MSTLINHGVFSVYQPTDDDFEYLSKCLGFLNGSELKRVTKSNRVLFSRNDKGIDFYIARQHFDENSALLFTSPGSSLIIGCVLDGGNDATFRDGLEVYELRGHNLTASAQPLGRQLSDMGDFDEQEHAG